MSKALIFTAAVLSTHLVIAAGVENPSCERVSPGVFRLEFETQDSGRVQIFADDNPDRIAASKPVATATTSPVNIRVPDLKGRVYFHLKPEHGTVRTVSTRQLPLEGAANFRDLGGYRTTDGKSVRWGKVYRSNNLAGLTDADYRFLESIHLKLVCDVRTEYERNQQPTKWQGAQPQFLLAPIGSEQMIREASASFEPKNGAASQTALVSETRGYEQFIADFAGQYDRVFHRLVAGEVPLMFHCSAGRDRTGTFAALLLTMLGVPRQTVVDDYVLTGKYLLADTNIEKMASDLQRSMSLAAKPDIAYLRTRLEMKPAVIESTFRVIDERYGSFDEYRRNQLHITDAQLGSIRKLLLEE